MLIINRYYQGRVFHAEHDGGVIMDTLQGTAGPIPGCRVDCYRRAPGLRGDATVSAELAAFLGVTLECCPGTSVPYPVPGRETSCPACGSVFAIQAG